MRKCYRWIFGLCLFILAMSTSSMAVALGTSYLDESVQALQSKTVYVSPSASTLDSATLAKLESTVNDASIAVVVLPSAAAYEADGDLSQFVTDLGQRAGIQTVVVAFGNDLEATSTTYPAASNIANNAENNSSSVGDALVMFVTEVATTQDVGEMPDIEAGTDPTGIVLIVSATAVGFGLLFAGNRLLRRRDMNRAEKTLTAVKSHLAPKIKMPEEVEKKLNSVYTCHEEINDKSMKTALVNIYKDLHYLFDFAPQDQIRSIAHAYSSSLESVMVVLSSYIDIQNHGRYYSNGGKLLADGVLSINAYADSVLEQVQKMKAGETINYELETEYLKVYSDQVKKSKE